MNVCGGVSVPHKPQVHILPLSRSMGFRVVAVVLVAFLKTGVLEEKAKGKICRDWNDEFGLEGNFSLLDVSLLLT